MLDLLLGRSEFLESFSVVYLIHRMSNMRKLSDRLDSEFVTKIENESTPYVTICFYSPIMCYLPASNKRSVFISR